MIFGDILVLSFDKQSNTHAQWKCLCMLCNRVTYVTATNLKSGHTKSCASCGQKKTNYIQEYEIVERLNNGDKISHIAKDYNVNRGVVYRIKDENIFAN